LSAALVVDASLTVQLVLAEPGSATVEAYLADGVSWNPLIAPSILVSETAAAITKKVRRKEISENSAVEAFRAWREILGRGLFELVPANDLIDAAFALSLRLDHPLHDCLYVALAQREGCALATRDFAMASKARALGTPVELIGV
jgi:predicted nucleic acid-binding protein